MRISEITSSNKPYIRIVKGKKRVDIPIVPKPVVLPPNKAYLKKFAFVGCDTIKINFKGKTVKLNWTFNHNRMTLYCSGGHKAYSWSNVKVATITTSTGKKEHVVVCSRDYGDETERRKYKRFPIIKNVTIFQGDTSFPGSTVDVSYGGVGIKVKSGVKIVPSEPLHIDFGTSRPVKARLVRTVFNSDGSELIGCFISKVFKYDMMQVIGNQGSSGPTKEELEEQKRLKETDKGWYESSIKRWR